MRLKEVEQVGEDEPIVATQPENTLNDERDYRANNFMLIGGGEEIVYDIDAVDIMSSILRNVQTGRPYQYAELSYVTEDEYNVQSKPDLTPSDPISWR